MKNIPELLGKLPTIATVVIQCYSKNQVLFPLKTTNDNVQMLFYWWSEASKELDQILGPPDVIQDGDSRTAIIPPTLLATSEQLQYVIDQLEGLASETQEYLNEAPLPASVKYKVERGYDKLMEAKFSTQTAASHYGELTRAAASGNQLGSR